MLKDMLLGDGGDLLGDDDEEDGLDVDDAPALLQPAAQEIFSVTTSVEVIESVTVTEMAPPAAAKAPKVLELASKASKTVAPKGKAEKAEAPAKAKAPAAKSKPAAKAKAPPAKVASKSKR